MNQLCEYDQMFPPDIIGLFLADSFASVKAQKLPMDNMGFINEQQHYTTPESDQDFEPALTDPTPSPLSGEMQLIHEEPSRPKLRRNSRSRTSNLHRGSTCETCSGSEVAATSLCKRERRRQQNRMSQQKFREKKEAKLHQASEEISVLQAHIDSLRSEKNDLHKLNVDLRIRIQVLERSQSQSSCSPNGLSTGDVGQSPYEVSDIMYDGMFQQHMANQMNTDWTTASDFLRTTENTYGMSNTPPIVGHWLGPHHMCEPSPMSESEQEMSQTYI